MASRPGAPGPAPILEVRDLRRAFGGVRAVDRASLAVEQGSITALIGPNGAGKTTTVRMLTGLISKTSGSARVAGCEVGEPKDELALRRRIGLLPENVGLYEGSSAYQNLEYFAELYDLDASTRKTNIERLLRMMGLWEKRDLPLGTFSKGMKQKVAIARALVHDPTVLFLDEPTANLDPEAAKTVRDLILDLQKEKRTIFVNTHNLDEAQRICTRIAVLRSRLLMLGTPEELKARLWGARTVVRVAEASEALAAAVVAKLGPRKVEVVGDEITFEVTDPDRENPEIVEALVAAGGAVRQVTQLSPTLEDVYLNLVHQGEGRP